MSIILASQSPRRKQLLSWAALDFEVVVAPTDETYPDNLPIDEIPIYIARQKAFAVENIVGKENIIIAADTVVVLNDTIIGKPKNREEAINILSQLSGNEHKVITGVVILNGFLQIDFADTTLVKFHELTQEQIIFYVDNYQPYDKAGAYAIQEWIGVVGIQSIQGDFYNVMGLPVSRVLQVLESF
jgi:septum formation protein